MPDFLDTASAWLDTVCGEQIGQTIEYRRGASSVEVTATIGATDFTSDNNEGLVEQWSSRDYFIAVADLIVGGQPIKPEAGDRIVEGTRTYEVLSPGDEQPGRYSDAYNRMWRLHTKLIRET